MTRVAGVAVVVVVLCAVGCGGLAIEDYDEALVDARCDRLLRCDAMEGRAACRKLLQPFGTATIEVQYAVLDGSVRYDEGALEECLDAIASAPCDYTAKGARVEPAACDAALQGTLAEGAACLIDDQCISGRCNRTCALACCEGTCAADLPRSAIGGPCLNASDCEEDAFCNGVVCRALLPADAVCTQYFECDYGLWCPPSAGRCVDAPTRGEPCPHGGCFDIGTFCDPSGVCVPLGRPGAPCRSRFDCVAPNLCDPQTLTCTSLPGLGEPCPDGMCVPGTYCNFSEGEVEPLKCAAEKADGQPCRESFECVSGHCDEATSTCDPLPTCSSPLFAADRSRGSRVPVAKSASAEE